MRKCYFYKAFGLRIQSEIPLPLLETRNDKKTNLQIRIENFTHTFDLGAPVHYRLLENKKILCCAPSVANFLIDPPHEILVEPHENVSIETIQLFLLGSAIGVVLHHEDGLPLHASAIDFDGRAVVFAGSSGIGKSTLATAFLQDGHRLLSDDISMIRFAESIGPVLSSAYPQMKLWRQTLNEFNIESDGLPSIYKRIDKFNIAVGNQFQPLDLPLKAIIALELSETSTIQSEFLKGARAYSYLFKNTYRIEHLQRIGNPARHFKICSALAQQVPVIRLARPRSGCSSKELLEYCKDLLRKRGSPDEFRQRKNTLAAKPELFTDMPL